MVAIGASSSVDALAAQAELLRPDRVALADPARASELAERLPAGVELLVGEEALAEIATGADVVVNGVVGFAGLPVTLAALQAGRRLALANKESLIAGGPVVQAARATPGAEIVPVDSEHCAIHQCLRAVLGEKGMAALPHPPSMPLRRLVLTASGGPFRGRLEAVAGRGDRRRRPGPPDLEDGPEDHRRLVHPDEQGPRGDRGPRAVRRRLRRHRRGGAPPVDRALDDRDDRRRHPGPAVAARHAPAHRLRPGLPGPAGRAVRGHRLGPRSARSSSRPPDREAFPCLDLAYRAGRAGGDGARPWLNGANEVAVAAFLDGRIRWVDIPEILGAVLDECPASVPGTVADVLDADRSGRDLALAEVSRRSNAPAMTATRPGWRESLEADPLGLASHRQLEEPPAPPPAEQRLALHPPGRHRGASSSVWASRPGPGRPCCWCWP